MKADIAANLRKITTLGELFNWRVRQTPSGEAYRHFHPSSGSWQSYTWEQIGACVGTWRNALAELHLPIGARVAILLPNGVDVVCIDQASLGLGLVPVPMHALDNPASIAYIIKDCDASVLLVQTHAQWQEIVAVGELLPLLQLVLVVEETASAHAEPQPACAATVLTLSSWLAGAAPSSEAVPEVCGGALAAIVYTSGTTGKPKGVMLTHYNVLSNVEAVMARVNVRPDDVFLSFLPLSHTFERTVGYYVPIAAGSCVAYARSVAQIPEDLKIVRPTVLVSVPRIYERSHAKLLETLGHSSRLIQGLFALAQATGWRRFCRKQQLPCAGAALDWLDPLLFPLLHLLVARKLQAQFGGRLRFAVCGGAPLSQAVAKCFLALGLPLLQGYGMTETSPVVACNTPDDNWPATVGKALEGVDIRIGENSELQVYGGGVMAGYWKRPEETAKVMTDDGWLRTGDQAVLEDERVRIVGRLKEIIVTSTGEKVPPADLELAITSDQLFEQAFAVGEDRPCIAVLVVLSRDGWAKLARQLAIEAGDGTQLNAPPVRSAVLARIQQASRHFPSYAVPRLVHITMEPWSLQNGLMTPTLKLKRNALLAHFHAEIDALYAQRLSAQAKGEITESVAG